MNQNDKLHPIHPGEVLLEEFLKPMKISQNELALALRVPARRINEIVLSKRRITVDTALRLAHYFGNSAQFWLGLQMDYDLDIANQELSKQITEEVQSRRAQ
jgi:addiction module HigA family antidote